MKNRKQVKVEQNKELLRELKDKSAHTTIVDKKLLTTSATKVDAKKTESATKRDIKAYAIVAIDKQSNYEKRSYMRAKTEDATVVRHKTTFTKSTMTEAMLKYMLEQKQKLNKTVFRTSDIQSATMSCGPSYTDVIRASAVELEKQHKIAIQRISENERTRAKYEYVLLV